MGLKAPETLRGVPQYFCPYGVFPAVDLGAIFGEYLWT